MENQLSTGACQSSTFLPLLTDDEVFTTARIFTTKTGYDDLPFPELGVNQEHESGIVVLWSWILSYGQWKIKN